MLSSDTSMTLQSTTGLPTATAITLVIDATDPISGLPTPTLKETVTGVVSGSTVTSLLRGLDGTTAQAHASGANVEMWITANLWNDFQSSYLTQHAQLGAHTGITNTGGLTTDTLTVTGNATSNGNPVWQYLGSVTSTSNFTTTSGSEVQITNLTITVTVPVGYTKVRVSCVIPETSNSGTNVNGFAIWRGVVGSGTQIAGTANVQLASGWFACVNFFGLDTPGTGSVTYNVGMSVAGGTGGTNTGIQYLVVECC